MLTLRSSSRIGAWVAHQRTPEQQGLQRVGDPGKCRMHDDGTEGFRDPSAQHRAAMLRQLER